SFSHSARDRVMALPLRLRDKPVSRFARNPPAPKLVIMGRGASKCAASTAPTTSLSRKFAQDTSRSNSTSRPKRENRPLACASTRGALSVSLIKPTLRCCFSGGGRCFVTVIFYSLGLWGKESPVLFWRHPASADCCPSPAC